MIILLLTKDTMDGTFASGLKKWLWFGVGLILIATSASIWYAAYSTIAASTGETLTREKWNEMIQYTVPPNAVMAFNSTTCPANWSPADGNGGRPDLRGQFIRGMNSFDGWITTRSDWRQDPTSRSLSSFQDQDTKITFGEYAWYMYGTLTRNAFWRPGNAAPGTTSSYYSGDYSLGTETRPKNIALIFCVKN